MTVSSPYVLERIRAFKEKERIVNKMLANKALAAQDYAHVKEEVNDKLRAMELGDVSDTWLRAARHKARAAHGLVFDGLDAPDDNPKMRAKVALEIAREHHGNLSQERLQELTRERLGGMRSVGSPVASEIIRRVRREVARGVDTMTEAPQPPFPTPASRRENGVPTQRGFTASALLSTESHAALGLVAEALFRDGVVTLTLSINPDGKASYIAEKRTISEVKGSI